MALDYNYPFSSPSPQEFGDIVQGTMDALQPYNILQAFTPDQQIAIRAGTTSFDCSAIIQAAIDAQKARGRTVFDFPDGLYLFNGTRGGLDNSQLFMRSDCTLQGRGWGTIFKLADNYTAGGDYSIIGQENATAINNFFIRGIHFDGNAANNQVLGSTGVNVRGCYSLKLRNGDNFEVSGCFFYNNPGRNVIIVGNNANPPSVTNARVLDNIFYGVGAAVTGASQNDHSTIYSQCDGAIIARNRFSNPSVVDPALTVVAVELHGRNSKVINNSVANYTYGGNSVSQVHDSEHQLWQGNHFRVSKACWSLFSLNFTLRDVKFLNNFCELDFGSFQPAGMIYQGRGLNVSTTPEDIVIAGNTFYCAITTSLAHSWSGIDMTCARGLTIRDNKIRNVQCAGILFNNVNSNQAGGFDNVIIEDNDIRNTGLHAAANLVWGIVVRNGGATVTVSIATPGVVTWTTHPFSVNDEIQFTTTGALPTGLTASTTYFIQSVIDANNVTLSLTPGGAAIATSGTQSGVHTGIATSRWFHDITIDNNKINKPTAAGVGNMRGMRIEGPGPVIRCRYKGGNETRGLKLADRYTTANTALFREVVRDPRVVFADRLVNSGNPVRGFFEGAGEFIQYANPTATTTYIKRVSVDGAAYGAVRADGAVVQKGDCIKDAGTVVYEVLQSGTLGTGNPVAPGVGSTVTDGGALLLELCATAAGFATGYVFP